MSITFPAKHRPGRVGVRRCAVIAAGLIAAIVGLHAYWALGGSWAADTLSGGHEVPPKGVIWLAAALLAATAIIHLGRVGIGWARGLPDGVLHVAAWVIAGAFWLAALTNLSSGNTWSMAVSAPVSALLAALATVVAMRRRDETLGRAGRHVARRA
jgi:hypothetical protein